MVLIAIQYAAKLGWVKVIGGQPVTTLRGCGGDGGTAFY
jgi:hypothetical protein